MRENAGTVDAEGIEAEARQTLADQVTLEAAIAYTHARVDGGSAAPQLTGLRPAQTPEVSATSGLVWRPFAPLSLRADLRYESARFDDDRNTLRIASSLSINARFLVVRASSFAVRASRNSVIARCSATGGMGIGKFPMLVDEIDARLVDCFALTKR